jgi:hypothetical protein
MNFFLFHLFSAYKKSAENQPNGPVSWSKPISVHPNLKIKFHLISSPFLQFHFVIMSYCSRYVPTFSIRRYPIVVAERFRYCNNEPNSTSTNSIY